MKKPAITKDAELEEMVKDRVRFLVAKKKERFWFWTRRTFPLEIIASTAARMPGLAISYSHAADEALQLLDACARIQERSQILTEDANSIESDATALGIDHQAKVVPYLQAVKAITGQSRADRAQADFLTSLRADIVQGDGTGGSELLPHQKEALTGQIAMYQASGFPPQDVVFRWRSFHRARELGRLKKKHRSQKISLPRKGRPGADKDVPAPARKGGRADKAAQVPAKKRPPPAKN